ncbi:hypothetical protein [Halosimplex halobium]|uniref:hypothetical protein n=1 Tax=Halosimplex halobium TaxID=3396618 RepID=UPI003F5517DF
MNQTSCAPNIKPDDESPANVDHPVEYIVVSNVAAPSTLLNGWKFDLDLSIEGFVVVRFDVTW